MNNTFCNLFEPDRPEDNFQKLLNHDSLFSELSLNDKNKYLEYLKKNGYVEEEPNPITFTLTEPEPEPHTNQPPQDPITFTSTKPEPEPDEPQVIKEEENTLKILYENVANYIKNNNPKLCILTPCYGSVCFVNYMVSLMSTMDLFRTLGFPIKVEFCRNDSLVSRARNNLVARAMNDPEMTHILFIDSDITWEPIDVLKLIIDDKPIIGGVYPLKKYNWDVLKEKYIVENWMFNLNNSSLLKKYIKIEDLIQAKLLKYNINYLNNVLQIKNNISEVKHVANGFMMIQRDVINTLMKNYPEAKYKDDVGFLTTEENTYAYALFHCGIKDEHYLSEDWYFCDSWTKLGGSIHINVSINLTHTGNEDFKGCYISSLV